MRYARIKLAMASAVLASAGLGITGGQVLAAEGTVPFSGSVGATCTLSNPVAGVLAQNTALPDRVDSVTEGTSGSIDMSCTDSASITVSGITTSTPTGFLPLSQHPLGRVTLGSTGATTDYRMNLSGPPQTAPITTSGALTETLEVDMYFLHNASPTPNGDYSGTVTVTADPL